MLLVISTSLSSSLFNLNKQERYLGGRGRGEESRDNEIEEESGLNVRLETNRLAMMQVQFTDANDVFMAVKESIAELAPWMPWANQGYNLRNAQEFIAEGVREAQAQNKFVFTVRGRSSGKLLGVVDLAHVPDLYGNRVPMFEVGYWMRSSDTGQGYSTEAVQRVVEYAIAELGAKRVFATAAGSHEAAQRVLQGAGLVQEAVLKNSRVLPNGKVDSTVLYAKA